MPTAPPPPSRPPPESEDEGGSFVLRFGTGVGAGALAASVAAVPAALRSAPAAPAASAFVVWIACTAAMILPMLVAVMVLRRARVGLRALGGSDAAARSLGVAMWLFTLFVFEALFGSVLRATTHHHALAGTTFALVSVGVATALAILCARVSAIVATRTVAVRRSLLVAMSGLLALAIIIAGVRFARAFSGVEAGAPSPGALLVDLLAFGIAAIFASRPSLAQRRALALAGPPVAAVLLAIGLWSLRSSNGVAEAIAAHAPALSPISGTLAGH